VKKPKEATFMLIACTTLHFSGLKALSAYKTRERFKRLICDWATSISWVEKRGKQRECFYDFVLTTVCCFKRKWGEEANE
jgi:hypothetical protein